MLGDRLLETAKRDHAQRRKLFHIARNRIERLLSHGFQRGGILDSRAADHARGVDVNAAHLGSTKIVVYDDYITLAACGVAL